MTEPNITLRYFAITGRAEPLRLALYDAGAPFEDVRISLGDWADLRQRADFAGPYAALPTLSWGADLIAETLPIASYLARKLGEYRGLDEREVARREAICSCCYLEVLLRCGTLIWANLAYPGADPLAAARVNLPLSLRKLDHVERQLHDHFLCGDQPGLADFFAAESLELLHHVLGPERRGALGARFPRLSEHAERIAERPRLANARAQRAAAFTARDDEAAVLTVLRGAELEEL